MIMNVAYSSTDKVSDIEDLSRPLKINCCGHFIVDSRPGITTEHPEGRRDYQLIYIASGKGHFYFDGIEHIVTQGHMILFRPHEPMQYYYYPEDKTDVYWVHFTGKDVPLLLKHYELPENGNIFYTGVSPDYQWIYRQLIRELQLKRTNYEEMLSLLLNHIFLVINRYIKESNTPGSDMVNEIERAVSYFTENYQKDISIEAYATERSISKNWFIHSFRRIMKVTPMQYILSLRISAAKAYLESTEKNITEIAYAVGYDNPLYFSRLFKKFTDQSPSEYRKQRQD